MRLTIDTSVALKLIVDEVGTDAAEALVASEASLIAPDLIHAEMTNALWSNVLSKRLLADDATGLLGAWQPFFASFYPVPELSAQAMRLAFDLNHAIYDCYFLALAIREDAKLVTADGKFLKSVSGTAYRRHVEGL